MVEEELPKLPELGPLVASRVPHRVGRPRLAGSPSLHQLPHLAK